MQQQSKHFRKRDAILSCVRGTTSHPSADWVFANVKEQMPDISLATVYRNLSLFKQQGLIQSLGTVKGVERFDGNTAPHVHFICTNCGCIRDLPEIAVPKTLTAAAETAAQANVEQCHLAFHGRCRACL